MTHETHDPFQRPPSTENNEKPKGRPGRGLLDGLMEEAFKSVFEGQDQTRLRISITKSAIIDAEAELASLKAKLAVYEAQVPQAPIPKST